MKGNSIQANKSNCNKSIYGQRIYMCANRSYILLSYNTLPLLQASETVVIKFMLMALTGTGCASCRSRRCTTSHSWRSPGWRRCRWYRGRQPPARRTFRRGTRGTPEHKKNISGTEEWKQKRIMSSMLQGRLKCILCWCLLYIILI